MKKLAVLSIILTIIISSVFAQTTIKQIKDRGYLLVGTSGNQLPYTYKQEDGTFVGVDIELAKELAKEMGVEAKFVQIEIPYLIDSLKAGNIDVILSGFSITSERNLEVMFTDYYFETGKAIFSNNSHLLSGKTKNINKSDVKLLALKNSSSIDFIKKHYPNATIVEGTGKDDCVEKLKTNQADAFIGDIEICDYYAYDGRFKNFDRKILEETQSSDHEFIAIAVSPNDILFFNFVNNFIKEQKSKNGDNDNEIEQNWERYYDYE